MGKKFEACEGHCSCGHVRYKVLSPPMIVHCCHCRICQRQTGSAFAVNALIEADRIELLSGEVEILTESTPTGKGQTIARCPLCKVALWSNYNMGGLKERIRFLRVGTLENPDLMPPDVHIFTSTKQSWVQIPISVKAVEIFYDYERTWSDDSLNRRISLFEAADIPMP